MCPSARGLSEPPAGEYADFVVGPVGRTGGAADEDRSIGIASADRCAAVVDFLLLVDEREIERLDRLVSEAHIEVLVLEIRGHILAQLRLIVASENRPGVLSEGVRYPTGKAVRLVADRCLARARHDR